MMHDFALTAGHVIFMDLPIVFDLDIAMTGKRDMPYRWDDNYGARLGVLRRDDPFGEVRWFDIDPCYVFHVANAYDRRQFDCAAGRPLSRVVARHQRLRRPTACCGAGRSTSSTGTVTERQLDDRRHRVPAHRRPAGRTARPLRGVGRRRPVWCATTSNTGSAVEHRFGTEQSPGRPGEAVFVPSTTGPADESNGWYLGYVYDPARDGSDLVIIDASDFAGDPVARIKLPQRVPYGFHGNWIGG